MSVINKMLRDLDRRAAQLEPQGRPALLDGGVASVDATQAHLQPHRESGRRVWVLAPAGGFVLLLLALVWFALALRGRDNAAHTAAVPVVPTMASPAAGVAPVPLADTPVPAAVVIPGADVLPQAASGAQAASATDSVTKAASVVATSVPPIAPAAGPRRDTPEAVPQGSRSVAASPASNPVGAVTSLRPVPASAPGATPAAAVTAPKPELPLAAALPEVRSAAMAWQDGARESLAQAQRLHAGGARDAAAELLREVLAGIERNHAGDDSAAGSAVVLALVRELVRIELLQEQYAAVLSTLRRHEGPTARQADLWAVRANAAQRLGQHAEASRSYQAALRLRPSEPRWMLAAAVSFALLGQTASASELAEQARALGGANPDVLAYLRQLGVTIRER